MGSGSDHEIGLAEAAQILKTSEATVRGFVKRGLLRSHGAVRRTRRPTYRFSLEEVLGLASRVRKKPNPAQIADMALRALAAAEAAEKRVAQIYSFLGLDIPVLPTEKNEVMNLYFTAQRLQTLPLEDLHESEVFRWAKTLFAMTDDFFRLLAQYTDDDESWIVFTALGQKIAEAFQPERAFLDPALGTSYAYLEAGRRNAVSAAYFYVRNRSGARVADRMFPDGRASLDEGIRRLLFPH